MLTVYSDSLEGEITHIGMPLRIVPLKNEIKKNSKMVNIKNCIALVTKRFADTRTYK